MRLLRNLFLLLIVTFAVLTGIACFMPDKAHGERSILIDRAPSMVFGAVNGYRGFNRWSPWAKLDPQASYERSGPETGVGARFSWKGNSDVGEGSQEIVVSEPFSKVQTKLDFGPMGQGRATFLLTPTGEGTQLTWSFDSDLPLGLNRDVVWNVLGRLMGPWIGDQVGKDYESGLASLKTLMESITPADLATLDAEAGTVESRPTYYVSTEAALDTESSAQALMDALGEISAFATLNALQQAGPPRAVINSHSADRWSFDATIPFDRSDAPVEGSIKAGSTHKGKVVLFRHVGSYDSLGETHAKATAWLAVHGWKESGRRSEIYVSDPFNSVEADRLAIIEVPVDP